MSAKDAPSLLPLAIKPLPVGSVRPAGWLREQLITQSEGLSGHLDEFWPDVAQSGWIGGQAEGWERGPYWLDGVVPLAYLLGDARLIAKVRRWMGYVLDHQYDDGWLGPVRDTARGDKYRACDPWPVFVFLKALTQFESATGDPRVIPALKRFLRMLYGLLREQPLFDWGMYRWADLVLSIHWLWERTGESWLLEFASLVHEQGYDWRAHFDDFSYPHKMAAEDCVFGTHVVNNAMALKQPGVWSRQSGDPGDREAISGMIGVLDRYHGQATGVFTGDEHYAGLSPSQGTELCAVVEYLFSLETLLSILGEPWLGDRLERIAYNALPATFAPDMWSHQYDQQANQVVCRVSEDRVYTNNGPEANIFGLEPNYGCCTSNMHQGWPKFAAHLWMRSADGGLVAVAHAPCEVETEVQGVQVAVEVETDYPFDEIVRYRVKAFQSVHFPLRLRIPVWAEDATVSVNSEPAQGAACGTFYGLEREWLGETEVTLRLPMPTRVTRRYHGSASISRGPLVYSLRIGEDWRAIGGEAPRQDWEVHPTSPWNYALSLDLAHPERSIEFEQRELGATPFSPQGAPVVARVLGRRLPEWSIEHSAAAPPPQSPVHSEAPLEPLELVPFGCTNLRVTEFPVLG